VTLSCALKAGNKEILIVSVDEEPYKEIHTSIFGFNPKFSSLEELAEHEYQGAKRYALKRLAMQGTLSSKLRDLLEERLVSTEVIDKVIEDCQQSGYLNDADWVDAFVRCQKRKRIGPQMIRMKLREKGVKTHVELDINERTQIKALLESKYKNRDLKDYKERQKVIASLMRKGYTLSSILEELKHDPDDI